MYTVTYNYNGRGSNAVVYNSYAEAKRFFNYIRHKSYVTRAELKALEA